MTKTLRSFPIDAVRQQFPALKRTYQGKSAVYLDGPGGSQVVKSSMDAIYAYMANGGANLHGSFPSSRETEATIAEARESVAQLFGAKSNEVVFGANMTTITFAIARALGRQWQAGDELVVSELDHRANVDPWLSIAEDRGMTVRWLRVHPDSLTLELEDLDDIITPRTKLVAVGLASNAVGTINDVPTIAAKAREVGAIMTVDAVHATPHFFVDRDQLGADLLLCSAYKFFGPHIGIAVIREELFESLLPYKLAPAPHYLPDKLETGTQNHEGIAGIKPAVQFIAGLGQGETLREQFRSGFELIESYENALAEKMRNALQAIPEVTLYQAAPEVPKTPTIAFRIAGISPQEVCQRMADDHAVFVADGDFYAMTLADKLGINQDGGWIRAGLAPYNTEEEIDRFIQGIQEIVHTLR